MAFRPDDPIKKPRTSSGSDDEVATEVATREQIQRTETKNGLPVIPAAEYSRMYNTDIRAAGADASATFDFQGYIRLEPGYVALPDGTAYKDSMATNGILRGEGEKGIHVGTDGVDIYDGDVHRLSGPEVIGEYDIYITIPPDMQERLGVYCRYDSCHSVADRLANLESYENREEVEAEIAACQKREGWIVMRLSFDPQEDPLARRKAAFIHQAIVSHLEQGNSPHEIDGLVRDLEVQLQDMNTDDLRQEAARRGIKQIEAK